MPDGFYNVVLRPDHRLEQMAVQFSQDFFSECFDGNCLSAQIYPHVTLGQFRTDDLQVHQSVVDRVEKLKKTIEVPKLSFSGFFARYCPDYGGPGFWLELVVKKHKQLSVIQNNVHRDLTAVGLTPLNASLDDYHPHLTFARILKNARFSDFMVPADFFGQEFDGWTISVGQSDQYGQFWG